MRILLLSMLRLDGQQTCHEMKSQLDEMLSRKLSIAQERFDTQVVALSVAPVASTVCVRIGGVIDPVALLNAVKMILDLAKWCLPARQLGGTSDLFSQVLTHLGMSPM